MIVSLLIENATLEIAQTIFLIQSILLLNTYFRCLSEEHEKQIQASNLAPKL